MQYQGIAQDSITGREYKMKTLEIKRIESKEDMLKWARAINNNPLSIAEKCDFQDAWARSNYKDLERFFMECNGDRKLVLCGVYNTMSYDEVERLLLHYAKTKGNEIVNKAYDSEMVEVNKMRSDVFKRESTLKDCLKSYWKRIASLRKDNASLRAQVERMSTVRQEMLATINMLNKQRDELKSKADKYDSIKSLLA